VDDEEDDDKVSKGLFKFLYSLNEEEEGNLDENE
jgi:hypothetical protein